MTPSNRLLLLSMLLASGTTAADTSPKRGLVFIPFEEHPQDDAIWTRPGTGLTWYYNYGEAPSRQIPDDALEFVPMMWGIRNDDPSDTSFLSSISRQLAAGGGRNIKYALAFNEPDGSIGTGGSNLDPGSAATAWVANFEPLRALGVKVGLPAVTGGPDGLPWLRNFLDRCAAVLSAQENGKRNCTFDFVPVHWYGNFEGMASHLGERAATFPDKDIWVTEFGYAHQSLEDSQEFYTSAMGYLDRLDVVRRYSYFGAFRSSESNVGPNPAFLNGDGQLTDIGSWYLGGDATGVVPSAAAGARFWRAALVWAVALGTWMAL